MTDDCEAWEPDEILEHWAARDADEREVASWDERWAALPTDEKAERIIAMVNKWVDDSEPGFIAELRPQCPQCRSTWLKHHARPGPRGAVIRWTTCLDCPETFDVEIDR